MKSRVSIWSPNEGPKLLASWNKMVSSFRFPPFYEGSMLISDSELLQLEGYGIVYSYTKMHPEAKSGQEPFVMAIVDFSNKVRVFGRIRGEGIKIGACCLAVPDNDFGYVFETVKDTDGDGF